MPTVVCMKWGTSYGADDVNLLHAMVRRHLHRPYEFVCVADTPAGLDPAITHRPLPAMDFRGPEPVSPWRKVSLFSPALADLDPPALFLDLDVLIVDDIGPFFDHPGRFCIIENWTTKGKRIGNSSVFRFEPGAHVDVFEKFMADPQGVMRRIDNSQTFTSWNVGELTWWPREWVRSFKFHCLPYGPLRLVRPARVPAGARIIAFHGRPKASDARAGRWPGKAYGFRPVPWIDDHLPADARP